MVTIESYVELQSWFANFADMLLRQFIPGKAGLLMGIGAFLPNIQG